MREERARARSRKHTRTPLWILRTPNGIVCKVISIWIWQNVIYTPIKAATTTASYNSTKRDTHTNQSNRKCVQAYLWPLIYALELNNYPAELCERTCVCMCNGFDAFGAHGATHCPGAMYLLRFPWKLSARSQSDSFAFGFSSFRSLSSLRPASPHFGRSPPA